MNLIPQRFTDLSTAIAYATATSGIVYGFGTLYKVYVGDCPQPKNVPAVWSAPTIDENTLVEWLMVI